MAHDCPECYTRCHCGGDIDDICFEGTPEEFGCTHCPIDGDPWEDDDSAYWDGDMEDETTAPSRGAEKG